MKLICDDCGQSEDQCVCEDERAAKVSAEVDRLKIALVLVRNGRQSAEILAFIDSVIGEETPTANSLDSNPRT